MSQRGFVAIPNHIIRDSTIPASARLLYGIIMSYAYGSRRCTASTAKLCDEAGIGRTAFFDALALLTKRGLVSVEKVQTAHGWRNSYQPATKPLHVSDDDEEVSPDSVLPPSPESGRRPGGVVRHTDDPPSAQPDDPPPDTHTRTRVPSAVEEQQGEEDNSSTQRELVVARDAIPSPSSSNGPRIGKFNGKPVSSILLDRAVHVLAAYNDIFDRSLKPFGGDGQQSGHLTQVLGKVIDNQDMELADFGRVLRAVRANPPSFCNGSPVGLGDIFGPKAWTRALENDGQPTAQNQHPTAANGFKGRDGKTDQGELMRALLRRGGELP